MGRRKGCGNANKNGNAMSAASKATRDASRCAKGVAKAKHETEAWDLWYEQNRQHLSNTNDCLDPNREEEKKPSTSTKMMVAAFGNAYSPPAKFFPARNELGSYNSMPTTPICFPGPVQDQILKTVVRISTILQRAHSVFWTSLRYPQASQQPTQEPHIG